MSPSNDVERHDGEKPPCIGQWCCGCAEHPVGKPWGWNELEWEAHRDEHHPLPPQPEQPKYRDEDFG